MKKILLVALAAITLASCAKNEVVELNEGNAISFRAWTANAGRVVPTTSESIKADGFTVWAYTETSEVLYMDALPVTWQTSKWDYTPHKFWPAESLHFYAVSPSTKAGLVQDAADKVQVVDFVQELAAGSQTDLLYAVRLDEDRQETAVPMQFDHALSQISFKAYNTNTAAQGIEVIIEGISVDNVNKKGTFTLPIDVETDATNKAATALQTAWDVTAAEFDEFVSAVVTPAPLTGTSTEITTEAGRLLLIPQTVAAWDPAVPTGDGARFLVNCTVKDLTSDIYLWAVDASTGGAKQLAIPFDANWDPGKHYIYTFIFGEGAGYDPTSGEKVLVPIKFEVTVDQFADGAAAGVDTL